MAFTVPQVFFGDTRRAGGSIACLARAPGSTGPLYLVSAAHVLAPLGIPDYRAARGTPVQCDFGDGAPRRVGSLLDWTPLAFAELNTFDAAIAEVQGDAADTLLRSLPLPTGVTYLVEENWSVCALGAMTRAPKRGHVKQRNATRVALRYFNDGGAREVRYDPTLHFTTDEISQVGDSGAAAIDIAGRFMGVLVGGSSSEKCSYFVKARPIFDRFGVGPVLIDDYRQGRSALELWGEASTPAQTQPEPLDEFVVDVLARTLWGEARSEGQSGMIAVANVVLNRSRRGPQYWWGGNIVEVCKMPYQFSCWNKDDPNRTKVVAIDKRDLEFRACLEVAASAASGKLSDSTENATHYHTLAVHPKWARTKTPCAQIGRHLFYNNIE